MKFSLIFKFVTVSINHSWMDGRSDRQTNRQIDELIESRIDRHFSPGLQNKGQRKKDKQKEMINVRGSRFVTVTDRYTDRQLNSQTDS